MPAREIDDAEAAHTDGHAVADIVPFVVRAAMQDDLAHAFEDRALRRSAMLEIEDSTDSAHG